MGYPERGDSAAEIHDRRLAQRRAERKESIKADWKCSLCDWMRENKTRSQVSRPFSSHNSSQHKSQATLVCISS